jgi:hypothetical protein
VVSPLSSVADRSGVFISLIDPLFNPLPVPPSVAERSGVKGRCLRGRFEKWGSRCPFAGTLVPARDILNVTPRRARKDSEPEVVPVKEGRTGAIGVEHEGDDKGGE